ncbi:hypothetical protein [Sinorhizobium saheli]|uniref:hypothetical protein n=2 Tax=Sinorhizobium saheli TaxID=36856 RepID=UPI001AECFD3B|nr:hypothetical protein [Sinorhizobium saheli]
MSLRGIAMMTNAPFPRIDAILDMPLARPHRRVRLAADRTYLKCRERCSRRSTSAPSREAAE